MQFPVIYGLSEYSREGIPAGGGCEKRPTRQASFAPFGAKDNKAIDFHGLRCARQTAGIASPVATTPCPVRDNSALPFGPTV